MRWRWKSRRRRRPPGRRGGGDDDDGDSLGKGAQQLEDEDGDDRCYYFQRPTRDLLDKGIADPARRRRVYAAMYEALALVRGRPPHTAAYAHYTAEAVQQLLGAARVLGAGGCMYVAGLGGVGVQWWACPYVCT